MKTNDDIRFHEQLMQLTAVADNEISRLIGVLFCREKYTIIYIIYYILALRSFRIPGYCQPWPDTCSLHVLIIQFKTEKLLSSFPLFSEDFWFTAVKREELLQLQLGNFILKGRGAVQFHYSSLPNFFFFLSILGFLSFCLENKSMKTNTSCFLKWQQV